MAELKFWKSPPKKAAPKFKFWKAPQGSTWADPLQEQHPEVERFKLQTFGNPESIARYLKENGFQVGQTNEGQLSVKKEGEPTWKVMDPGGLDSGDWKDLLGDAFVIGSQVVGSVVGAASGLFGGGPVGAVAGGAVGGAAAGGAAETARQTAGKFFGIDPTVGEVAAGAGTEAALGAVGEVGGRVLAKGVGLGVKALKKGGSAVAGSRPVRAMGRGVSETFGMGEKVPYKALQEQKKLVEKLQRGDARGNVDHDLLDAATDRFERMAQRQIPADELDKLADRRVREAVGQGTTELLFKKVSGDKGVRRIRAQAGPDVPAPTPAELAAKRGGMATRTQFEKVGGSEYKKFVKNTPPHGPQSTSSPWGPSKHTAMAGGFKEQVGGHNIDILKKEPALVDEALGRNAGRYVYKNKAKTWKPYTRIELSVMDRPQLLDKIGGMHKGFVSGKVGRQLGPDEMRFLDPDSMGAGWKTMYPRTARAMRPEGGQMSMVRAPTARMKFGAMLSSMGGGVEAAVPGKGLAASMGTIALASGNPGLAVAFGTRLFMARTLGRGAGRKLQRLGRYFMRDTGGTAMHKLSLSKVVPEKVRIAAKQALEVLRTEGVTKYRAAVYAMLQNPDIRRHLAQMEGAPAMSE